MVSGLRRHESDPGADSVAVLVVLRISRTDIADVAEGIAVCILLTRVRDRGAVVAVPRHGGAESLSRADPVAVLVVERIVRAGIGAARRPIAVLVEGGSLVGSEVHNARADLFAVLDPGISVLVGVDPVSIVVAPRVDDGRAERESIVVRGGGRVLGVDLDVAVDPDDRDVLQRAPDLLPLGRVVEEVVVLHRQGRQRSGGGDVDPPAPFSGVRRGVPRDQIVRDQNDVARIAPADVDRAAVLGGVSDDRVVDERRGDVEGRSGRAAPAGRVAADLVVGDRNDRVGRRS